MKATIPYIEKKFEEFNQLIFEGKLPKLPIELSDAKTFLGMCVYKKRRTLWGKMECYDFKLRINTRIDLAEAEVEDIIIHEMIHYYIGYNKIVDTSAHGKVFRQLMQKINEQFGRHIRISHKPTQEQKEQMYGTKRQWRVVAFVVFKDGRTGIKVLPRIVPKIRNYYDLVGRESSVESIEMYMTNDTFFNRYPSSSALRVHYIDRADAEKHLEGANRLAWDGDRLIRQKASSPK
ncbi:MAG: SprT-like domain-containing protein [Bacteroidaceae bacterium]|nr:SprT-like domain-containing protein [Bacteroidaceae bacterium]